MSEADRIVGLYDRHGKAFDEQRSRNLIERQWLDRFLVLVPDGGQLLDLGCGMGEPVARYLIDSGRRVTGVDSSPGLIALARERMPEQDWRLADMRNLNLGAGFDGVIAWHSFFHLSHADQRAMFAVFARHARPGAPLIFASGPNHGEAIGAFEGEPLYHASLAQEEYRDLLARSGFDLVANVIDDASCGGGTIWLAQRN